MLPIFGLAMLPMCGLLRLPMAGLLMASLPSRALRSRKLAHSSARVSLSLEPEGSENTSADNEGELGVLWKGDIGRRRLPLEAPGLARPACSRCSSVQLR